MIKRGILVLIALALFLAFPGLGQAQDGIDVVASSVQADFPWALAFKLEAESPEEIVQVVLRFQLDRLSHVPVVAEVEPSFSPGTKVEVSWTWDLEKAGGLPPGAGVGYWWTIRDAAGDILETPRSTLRFDDPAFAGRSPLTRGQVSLFWYRGDEAFAQQLMEAALQALDKLARDTGARLEGSVRVYIYANAEELRASRVYPQEWEGGVAFPDYGIVAIGVAPAELAWGKRAIAHELAHLVVHRLIFGPYGGDLPLWLDEGLATYAEGEPSQWTRPILEKAIADSRLLSVRSLSSPFSIRPEEAFLSYAQSYSLVKFLIDAYGRDKMLELLGAFREGAGYDGALEAVYGFDRDGLDARWRQGLGIEAAPALAATPTPALPRGGFLGCQGPISDRGEGRAAVVVARWARRN